MCGIAGHFNKNAQFANVEDALGRFRHRGPDSTATFQDSNIIMGYNRLSITNLATGHQPLFNNDKTILVFYNGEIYNHHDLRSQIKMRVDSQINRVDGAVIPYLYEIYGDTFAEKLDGMYAIALYDIKRNRLLLARDLVGEKPLYYWNQGTEVFFSSSVLGIRSMLREETTLDHQGIWDYPSFLWIPEPRTVFKDVSSLMPGETLVFDSNGLVESISQDFLGSNSTNDSDSHVGLGTHLSQELYSTIENSVTNMIPAEVPFGTFLSSGLDSSIVSTVAFKKSKDKSLNTFCVQFPDLSDPYHGFSNESTLAAECANHLGTNHHTVIADASTVLRALDDFVQISDSPFAVSSGLGVFLVSKKAKELGLKVLLSGDGADELYGGYSWYKHLPAISQIANANTGKKFLKLDETLVSFQNANLTTKALIETVGRYEISELVFALHYYMLESEKKELFSKSFYNQLHSSYRLTDLGVQGKITPMTFINHDRKFYLSQEMMRKIDRYTMAHSIEGRVPFVSAKSLEFSSKLNFSQLVQNDVLKASLRQAFSDVLPIPLTKRQKHGFNVPIDHWLKNDWSFLVSKTFSKKSMLGELGIIGPHSESIANQMLKNSSRLNGHSIFSFIILEKWLTNVYRRKNS